MKYNIKHIIKIFFIILAVIIISPILIGNILLIASQTKFFDELRIEKQDTYSKLQNEISLKFNIKIVEIHLRVSPRGENQLNITILSDPKLNENERENLSLNLNNWLKDNYKNINLEYNIDEIFINFDGLNSDQINRYSYVW